MSLVYTITIVPHVLGTVVIASTNILETFRETRNVVKTVLHLFYICSSLINPIITMLGKADYKDTLLMMCGNKSTKKTNVVSSKATQQYSCILSKGQYSFKEGGLETN